ncbi:MAG: hypothetical protein Q7T36_10430 [Fluviicoccus sp.]|uniref:hypothetical protein n=1 Tax=Fluviicoccus sp. TaxID=2003552 RepID=UPI0027184E35|nr:hypothetical protein [Fluviicoccus sp.]MDO8330871.1 hypothetical protein [Fluviicoccus sp.]
MEDPVNIFQMYYANGKKAGFWVMRDSWKHLVARVVSVSGIESGPLKGLGRFPFFNEAKEAVYAETYELIKTEGGYLFKQALPKFDVCPTDSTLSIISCPGTYAYTKLDLSGKSILVQKMGWNSPQPLAEPITPTFHTKRKDILPEAEHLAIATTFTGKHGALEVGYDPAKEVFSVKFPYSAQLVECVKSAPSLLRTFNAEQKVWTLDVMCVSTIVELIKISALT